MEPKKVILIILDGWGIAADVSVSAIDAANPIFYKQLLDTYSHSKLEASGIAVGLPIGQMGNSEVGHTNLGAGRIVYQDLVRLNLVVEQQALGQEPVIAKAFEYAAKYDKKLHLVGLVSDGGVHSHIEHLKGLCSAAQSARLTKVFVHAFTDGRDTDPKSGMKYLTDLQNHLDQTGGQIASIIGRYYAMDRDNRWERIALAYHLLTEGKGTPTQNWQEAIQQSYEANITDEFVLPICVTDAHQKPLATIEENDVVLFFNFRTDRGRQLTTALTQKDFLEYDMKPLPLYFLTMTSYDDTFTNVQVIFGKENLSNTLGEIVANAGKKQIRIAETEKYPHVTFFFSGGRQTPFENETRLLCPSAKVATYDLAPEMSAYQIADTICPELEAKTADFVCLNFANADMVGHTGVFGAAVKACRVVDECLTKVVNTALAAGYTCVILADHGNSDYMRNPDGSPNTAHTTNPVPFIIADPDFETSKAIVLKNGKLGDVAPTILKLMQLPIPEQMNGDLLF